MKNNIRYIAIVMMLFFSTLGNGQKITVQAYDTTWTRLFLRGELRDAYESIENDTSGFSILFFQVVNLWYIESLVIKQYQNGITLRFITKDSVCRSDTIYTIDFEKFKNLLAVFKENVEIRGEVYKSNYDIVAVIKKGPLLCQVKTTSWAFFEASSIYIESLRSILAIVGIKWEDFIPLYIDG